MKKCFLLTGFLVALCVVPRMAGAEQAGVYITPKFVVGSMLMDDSKIRGTYAYGGSETIKISGGSDTSFGGALALGYNFSKRFNIPVRAEIEYAAFSETENKASVNFKGTGQSSIKNASMGFKQRFSAQTVFVNAYYDFATDTAFTPYVGGGIGMAFIDNSAKLSASENDLGMSFSAGSKNTTNFAWNVGAGVAYDFTENLALDLGYRFVGLGSVKTKSGTIDISTPAEKLNFHGETNNLYMHQIGMGLRISF